MFIEFGMPVPGRGSVRAFAAGHLGELTQIIRPALVDEALELTRRVQRRTRKLPARVTVYFVLALSLFGTDGYLGVWAALTAGLGGEDVAPSEAALRQARRRVGSAPLAILFDRLKGPAAKADCSGAWWRGLRTVAWDGTGLQIADTPETAGFFGRKISCHGPGSYPALKLSALVECGTRALIDVVFGPHDTPEPEQNAVLCRSLRPGMLVLADRASDGYPLMCKAVATGADLLWRIQNNRSLAVIHTLPDGSYLSMVADVRGRDRLRYWARHPRPVPPQVEGIAVRVIDATVTATGADGSTRTGTLRLVTTLLDPDAYPAEELITLYHERWEAETAFYGLKVTLRGSGRILRSRTVDGIRQELFGMLVVYQAARRIAADAAAETGIDPDRISLTVTLRTARLTVINATGTVPEHDARPTPRIRSAVLHPRALGPARRRTRIWPRRIKRPISPFAYNKSKWDKPMRKVTITSEITPPTTLLTGRPGP